MISWQVGAALEIKSKLSPRAVTERERKPVRRQR
jgi:hypothetical protein